MENMENVVMNGDVMTDGAEPNLGGKVGKGLLIVGAVAAVGMLLRKGVTKVRNTIKNKKAAKADVVIECDEVPCEEE